MVLLGITFGLHKTFFKRVLAASLFIMSSWVHASTELSASGPDHTNVSKTTRPCEVMLSDFATTRGDLRRYYFWKTLTESLPQNLVVRVRERPIKNILEVGVGSGGVTDLIMSFFGSGRPRQNDMAVQYYGVDVDADALNLAHTMLGIHPFIDLEETNREWPRKSLPINVHFINSDIKSQSLKSKLPKEFDVVIFRHVNIDGWIFSGQANANFNAMKSYLANEGLLILTFYSISELEEALRVLSIDDLRLIKNSHTSLVTENTYDANLLVFSTSNLKFGKKSLWNRLKGVFFDQ